MMFDRHYRLYARILLVADFVAVFPALLLAYNARFYFVRFAPEEVSRFFNPELLPFQDYFFYLLLFLPCWFLLLLGTQQYQTLLRKPWKRQLAWLFNLFFLSGSLMGLGMFVFQLEISRPIFFVFCGLLVLILPLNRLLLSSVLRSRNINEHNQVRILIVGTDRRALRVAEILEGSRKWGFHVVGFLRMNGGPEADPELEVVGALEDLPRLLQEESLADEVIFSGTPRNELENYLDVVRLCEDLGIRTRVAADLIPASRSNVSLEFLDNLPLISFSTAPEHNLSIVVKRVIDFVVAALGLILLTPLMLVTAIAIKFTSPGPVFYRQVRCGLYGRKFLLTKFRTMIDGAEDKLWEIRHLNEMDGPVFKMRNDPRVTPLGRILRKTSIDELPQLWNVIKGEMSIVGPRAPLPEEVAHYSIQQRRRLSVKPGVTCLWQISGRSEINFQTWMDMDLEYIDNWSVWLDLVIILKTIPAVFTGRGAH